MLIPWPSTFAISIPTIGISYPYHCSNCAGHPGCGLVDYLKYERAGMLMHGFILMTIVLMKNAFLVNCKTLRILCEKLMGSAICFLLSRPLVSVYVLFVHTVLLPFSINTSTSPYCAYHVFSYLVNPFHDLLSRICTLISSLLQ